MYVHVTVYKWGGVRGYRLQMCNYVKIIHTNICTSYVKINKSILVTFSFTCRTDEASIIPKIITTSTSFE